jgi:hypothetical protein
MNKQDYIDGTYTDEMGTWRVDNVGTDRVVDGEVEIFVESRHTTKGHHQRNGFVPIGRCEWVRVADIEVSA